MSLVGKKIPPEFAGGIFDSISGSILRYLVSGVYCCLGLWPKAALSCIQYPTCLTSRITERGKFRDRTWWTWALQWNRFQWFCNFSLHVVNFLFPKPSPGYGEGIYWGPLVFQEDQKQMRNIKLFFKAKFCNNLFLYWKKLK